MCVTVDVYQSKEVIFYILGKYDTTRLIRYPGFNVDVPEGVNDVSNVIYLFLISMYKHSGMCLMGIYMAPQILSQDT